MPWPEEQVVVQQGYSHLEEFGLQTYRKGKCTQMKVLVEDGGADSTVAACFLSQVNA